MKTLLTTITLLFLSSGLQAEADPLRRVALELAKGIGRVKDARVAVLAMPHHDRRTSEGPFMVSERLSANLANDKRLVVLERSHMVQILKELRLSETGVLDSKTAQQIGLALKANVIITGTLINLESDQTEVNARALFSDTGKVIAASRTIVPRMWRERPRLGW